MKSGVVCEVDVIGGDVVVIGLDVCGCFGVVDLSFSGLGVMV